MSKKRFWLKIFSRVFKVLLFTAISVYALFNVYGYRYDLGEQNFKKTGVMDMDGYPTDSAVIIDGALKSSSLPTIISDVEVGMHRVVISHKGFQEFSKKIDLPEQLILPLKTVYLLPLDPGTYRKIFTTAVDQAFETDRAVIFLASPQKRIIWFEKQNGKVRYLELPTDEPVLTFQDFGTDAILFSTSHSAFRLDGNLWRKVVSGTSLGKIEVDSHADNIFFLENQDLYHYDIIANKQELLIKNVTNFSLAPRRLLVCDSTQKSFSFDVTNANNLAKSVTATALNLCPLDTVENLNNQELLLANTSLFQDGEPVEQGVTQLILNGSTIWYAKGMGLYSAPTKESRLVTRFSETIQKIVPGPDEEHVFVLVGHDLLLCDSAQMVCPKVMTLPVEPSSVSYLPQQKQLLVLMQGNLYSFDFSFWK